MLAQIDPIISSVKRPVEKESLRAAVRICLDVPENAVTIGSYIIRDYGPIGDGASRMSP